MTWQCIPQTEQNSSCPVVSSFLVPLKLFSSYCVSSVERPTVCAGNNRHIQPVFVHNYGDVHNFVCMSKKHRNRKLDLLPPEKKRALLSSVLRWDFSTRCSRQKQTREEEKGPVQMFDLFVWTCSEYALPGLLFPLLQVPDVSCPKEWQTHWLIGYNYNHKTGCLHRHYWCLTVEWDAVRQPNELDMFFISQGVSPLG